MPLPLALVIGAGPGLGLALACRFARGGFAVGLVVQQEAHRAPFQTALTQAGASQNYIQVANVADANALEGAFRQLQADHGSAPQVLVYNASLGSAAPASALTPDALQQAFRVNVAAALQSVQLALPAMLAAQGGTILLTGGGLALTPQADQPALSIGKAGLRTLALCLADELAPHNIHVATLTIAGFIQPHTPFNADALAEVFWDVHTEAPGEWRREVVMRA